jgi:hypothetical protein
MDNVRVGKDIQTYDHHGQPWVAANSGGVSTFSVPSGQKHEYELPQGYNYDASLHVVNDHGDHFNWQPAHDMPLQTFIQLLQVVNSAFGKIS